PSLRDRPGCYHPDAGERRSVTGTENVSAGLNTRTSSGRRSLAQGEAIELIAGEVAVSSACSADRPFIVLAGGGQTRSSRAKFDVRYDGDVVRVTCFDGAVQIEQAGATAVLQGSQQASYSDPR